MSEKQISVDASWSYLGGLQLAGHRCRALNSSGRQFADFGGGLHRVHQAYIWVVAEHVVVTMLPIDELELVELHILCSLL